MANAKRGHRRVKFSKAEMESDLPAEIDFSKLPRAGVGPGTIQRLAERSKRMIGLDPDVAEVFGDSQSVNNVLRAIIAGLPATTKRRKKSA